MNRALLYLFSVLLTLEGCYYTLHSTEGNKISTAQIQEIKLGKTTEADLLRILGPPSRKDAKPVGTTTLLYIHTEVKSPTLLGGFVFHGIAKEEEEVFEVILKDGVVQNYHFLKQ